MVFAQIQLQSISFCELRGHNQDGTHIIMELSRDSGTTETHHWITPTQNAKTRPGDCRHQTDGNEEKWPLQTRAAWRPPPPNDSTSIHPPAYLKAKSMQNHQQHGGDVALHVMEDKELLILERQRTAALEAEVKQLKEALVQMSEFTEMEEERITNRLIKRLHDLKQEKEKLAMEVEREEELLTNSLVKKLQQLQKEKVDLENKLEHEQEYIVNKLYKQLEAAKQEKERLLKELAQEDTVVRQALESQVAKILSEKVTLENELEQEQEFLVNRLQKQLASMQAEKRRLERKMAKDNVVMCDKLQEKLDGLRVDHGDNVNELADGMAKVIASLKRQQVSKMKQLSEPAKDDSSLLSWSLSVAKEQLASPELLNYQHVRRGTM